MISNLIDFILYLSSIYIELLIIFIALILIQLIFYRIFKINIYIKLKKFAYRITK